MMAFQLCFTGRTLRLADPATIAAIEQTYPFVTGTQEVERLCLPGGRIIKLSAPFPPNRHVGINELWYPTSASRFSIFRCLAAAADVSAMIATVFGSTSTRGTFQIRSDGDATDGGVTTSLYLLPPRPIADLTSTNNIGQSSLYWLTFVDERYWWSKTPAGIITCDATTSTDTWGGLLTVLASALGITLTLDSAIEAVYGYPEPDSALYSNNENAAVMLDAVLANLGRVLVRNLDGSYLAVRCNTAIGYAKTDRASYTKRCSGGQILVDALAEADSTFIRGPLLPATFKVSFPQWLTGSGYVEPGAYRSFSKDSYGAVFTETISTSGLASPYSGFATTSQTVALRTTAKALVTVANGTPTNAATCLALAQQLATDWIDGQLAYLDETYRGIVSINPRDGYNILWNYREPSTRIIRQPFGYGFCEFQHGFGPETAAGGTTTLTVEYSDGSLVVDPTATLGVVPDHGLILSNPSSEYAELDLAPQLQSICSLSTTQVDNLVYQFQNLTYAQIQNLVYEYQNLTYTQVTNLVYQFQNLSTTQIDNLVYLFANLTYVQFQTLVYFFANISLSNTQIGNFFYLFTNLTYTQLTTLVYLLTSLTYTQFTNLVFLFANVNYTQVQVLVNLATDSSSSLAGDVTGALGANSVGKLKGVSLDTTAASPGDADILIYRSATGKWVPNPLSEDVEMTDTGGCTVVAIQGTAVSSTAPTDAQVFIYNSAQWVPRSLSQDVTITDTGVATVKGLQSKPVSSIAPTTNQILQWNGTAWTPTTYIAWPCTTAGDLPYENATPAAARLPIGSNGQILTVVSGLPSWQNSSSTGPAPSTACGTLSAAASSGQIVWTWSAPSAGTFTSYLLVVGTGTGESPSYGSYTIAAGTTTYTLTGLTNLTTYYAKVYPVYNGANGPASNEASATPSTYYFYDNFNGTNGTALPSHAPPVNPGTNSWVNASGVNSIESNQAQATTAASTLYGLTAISTFNTGLSNFSMLQAQLNWSGSSAITAGIIFRATNYSNCFYLGLVFGAGGTPSTAGIALYLISGGSASVAGSSSFTPTSGDTIGVSCSATLITVYHNGTSLFTYTSATYESNTIIGIINQTSSVTSEFSSIYQNT